MNSTAKLIAATTVTAGLLALGGCQTQPASGGYMSTSSEQNVGSRSSHGVYGGTANPTGGGEGGTEVSSAPATPYSTTEPSAAATATTAPVPVQGKTIGPVTPP